VNASAHEQRHLLLLKDILRGLADIEAGRTQPADAVLAQLQERRAAQKPFGKPEQQQGLKPASDH